MLLSLDRAIVVFVNGYAHRAWSLDALVHFLTSDPLLKGGLMMTVFAYVWFQAEPHQETFEITDRRRVLLHSLLICIPALMLARGLGYLFPFRTRPLYEPALNLHRAFTFDANSLETWSSFPSDHAVLFFALATGVFLVSRRTGVFLYAYTVIGICLPRVYMGLHYPSDILAGAVLGVAAGYTARWSGLRSLLTRPALHLHDVSPGLFYASFFFLAYQTADLYDPLRGGFRIATEVLESWIGRS